MTYSWKLQAQYCRKSWWYIADKVWIGLAYYMTKIKSQQMYHYQAVDRQGHPVDVRLSAKRDLEADEEFFKQARPTVNYGPHTVTNAKHTSYPKAISKQLGRKVKHRTSHYLKIL